MRSELTKRCNVQAQLFNSPWFAKDRQAGAAQTRSLSFCSGSQATRQETACTGQVWVIVLPLRNPGIHTVVSCSLPSSACQCLLCLRITNPGILQHEYCATLKPSISSTGNLTASAKSLHSLLPIN